MNAAIIITTTTSPDTITFHLCLSNHDSSATFCSFFSAASTFRDRLSTIDLISRMQASISVRMRSVVCSSLSALVVET